MKRVYSILTALLISTPLYGNQLFDVSPSVVSFEGSDIYGEAVYEVTVTLNRKNERILIDTLTVEVNGTPSEVDATFLQAIEDPDFNAFEAVNDTGTNGNLFYFRLPYGSIGTCRAARREELRPALVIFTNEDGGIETVTHSDPCNE